ncbi:hypothetical protein M2146_001065 [Lachnospiraceae bacterium PF1-22]
MTIVLTIFILFVTPALFFIILGKETNHYSITEDTYAKTHVKDPRYIELCAAINDYITKKNPLSNWKFAKDYGESVFLEKDVKIIVTTMVGKNDYEIETMRVKRDDLLLSSLTDDSIEKELSELPIEQNSFSKELPEIEEVFINDKTNEVKKEVDEDVPLTEEELFCQWFRQYAVVMENKKINKDTLIPLEDIPKGLSGNFIAEKLIEDGYLRAHAREEGVYFEPDFFDQD